MRRFKRNRVLAVMLTVAMLLGVLPADLLGGIARVQAAENPSAESVGYTQGEWTVSSGDSNYECRTTTWDFTTAGLSSSAAIAVGESVKGIEVVNAKVQLKSGTQGLSIQNNAMVQVPLDSTTTDVIATLQLTSNNSNRYLVLGGDVSQKVYHNARHTDKTEADGAFENEAFTGTYDSSYFTGGYFRILSGTTAASDSGESKIGTLTLTEQRVKTVSGDAGGSELITYESVYNFCDGSIIPTDTINGTANVTSSDGKLTVAAGSQNGYGYNGAQHGSIFKAGNTITIAVKGKAVIEIGGCRYSKDNATAALSMGGSVLDTKNTKTTDCYHSDSAQAITFSYDGGEGDLVLTFDGGETYVPCIKVKRTEPKPAVTEVKAAVTVNDPQGILNGGGYTVKLVNAADAAESHDITTASATEYTLKSNASYNVSASSEDIKATVNGKTSIATGVEALTIKVDVASTVVSPMVTIRDTENLLGGADVTLTNNADSNEVHKLTSGAAVKLKIGASYMLACSSAAVNVAIGGGRTLTVKEDLTEIQVDVTKADTTHHTLDVWDFGAEQLADTDRITYNNKLTADIINGWYPGVAPGSKNKNIPGDLTANDADGNPEFVFHAGGKTSHRYRTINTNLTRYDEKELKDIEDNTIIYKGYIYSNSGSTDAVNVQLAVKAGDIVTFAVSRNNAASDLTWRSPSGEEEFQTYSGGSSQAQRMTFYAKEDGMYTLYSANEKLVVGRILRERPASAAVSGSVTAPSGADLSSAKLVFTNDTTGVKTEASIVNKAYTVSLQEQYTYSVSLEGANGYIVGATNSLTLENEAGSANFPIEIIGVELLEASGSLAELTPEAAAKLKLTFESEKVFVPEVAINTADATYTGKFEKGVEYTVSESGVEDYILDTTSFKVDAAGTKDIHFTKKTVYAVTVNLEGPTAQEAEGAKLTFTRVDPTTGETDENYAYTFTGTQGISLRDGQYKVKAEAAGYTQQLTADLKVNGGAVTKTIVMKSDSQVPGPVAYKEQISVGADGEYRTINDALDAVRRMNRTEEQRVTLSIAPGNYEEMLVIDMDNVTLKNASASPSIELKNKGVDISDDAVRITSYYGHGYTYYSMGADCKYDSELLAVNKENGYPSFKNPGSGTSAGSYWNATVTVNADGFRADGIIFENSFNQYMSAKAAEDVIVAQDGAKEGSKARAGMEAGDVTVQNKAYVERAAALSIYNNRSGIIFDNCKFVGRQDTLYGGKKTYAEFNKCSIYGGTDYIFGGMTAIFNKCDLVFNTSDDKNDVGYITAAQQTGGRGYLMYECHVTSTVPGVDTASQHPSKPGYLGRPWQAATSEVVFYNTRIDAADAYWADGSATGIKNPCKSLIVSEGWSSGLSGESEGMYEYGTVEAAADYTPQRVSWSTMLDNPVLKDGTAISLDAFRKPVEIKDLYTVDLSSGLKKGVVYDGGVSVLEDMAAKAVAGDTIGGTVYTSYVAGGSNPKTEGTNSAGNVPDSGSVLKLAAEKDGKLKLAMKINSGKTVYLVDEATNMAVDEYTNSGSASELAMRSYNVEAGHTYYFYGKGTKVPMYAIVVDYREPAAWDSIAAPVLGDPIVDNAAGTITVPFTAQVGGIYADSIEVKMLSDGGVADTVTYTAECSEGEVVLEPQASGSYSFQAVLRRSGALGKNSNTTRSVDFVLPMRKPVIINVENQGGGAAKFSWKEVPEAQTYRVYLDGALKETVDRPFFRFSGLTVGTEYEFGVEAVRGGDVSPRATITQTITAEAKKTWSYAAFGSGVDTKNNGYSGSIEDNNLMVWSKSGKGKLVPASTDGLAFYYTTMDPETENFTLSADVVIDEWTYSNGQEGFGLMAADTVGEDGDSGVFWNNSYMASVTKVEYYWDKSAGAVSDSGSKYTMKLGVGSQEKIGVTKENLASETTVNDFKSVMTTLETYCPANNMSEGTYNRAAGYTNKDVDMGDANPQTRFHLTIQRNNTGYFLSYTDENGVTTTKKYYHGDEGDELTGLDENNIYIGFYASRNAGIKIENVQLTTVKPEEDAPAEVRPITYVTPSYGIESASTANAADYELVYYGNADGTLTVKTGDGAEVVTGVHVAAKTKFPMNTTLRTGDNRFEVEFTPDADYKPSKYELLSSYATKKFTFTVNYKASALQNIYISPEGKPAATGTRENPMDIYSAVKNAAPGQKLLLMEGTYKLDRTVTVARGIDGTAEKKIYMLADPQAAGRPVLDFQKKCAGMVMAGDYWYFQGFDVTNSSNGQKGVQVSGSYNVLDGLHTYKNGNTGIQISRYKGTDLWEDWPSNNLILNCTSYLNADAGYEDADGFAAKLTIADGNVFDGCIAAYNADDGWDLFAKVESGPIGKVTIRNSVAFKNGYIIDENGNDKNAGNGNGFKMGGSSISGYHTLENSISFANKSKGIDSNSCPDIQVYRSTSYNNESFNVAFYTNDAKNTDFFAQGVLSFKDGNTVAEQIKLKGLQDESKVYGAANYFFNGKKSVNTEAKQVTSAWFVNTDEQAAIHGGITRNADGTINMNGFLVLTDQAPADAGARLSGSASEVVTVSPDSKAEAVNNVNADFSLTLPESVLTDAVRSATGCNSVEELKNYLLKEITGNADADKILPGVDIKNTVILEVKVRVSYDGGYTWEEATEENFPANGIDLLLPYPTGTSSSENEFIIAHLVTLACNGAVPGSTEYYKPTKTAEGLKIHLTSASPFAVGWVNKDDNNGNNNNNNNNDDNDSDGSSAAEPENSQDSKGASNGRRSPKTIDNSPLDRTQSAKAEIAQPDGAQEEEGAQAAKPVIVAAAPGAAGAVFHWWLILAAAILGCAAAAVGVWNYRKKKEEEH